MVAHLLDQSSQAAVLGIGRSPAQNAFFGHVVSRGTQAVPAPLPQSLRHLDNQRYSYLTCDLGSAECSAVLSDFQPTTVVHLAGSLRGESEDDIFHNNVRTTEGLLDSIAKSAVRPRLLLASTAGVYGNQSELPIQETALVDPGDAYSRSKLFCERLVASYGQRYSAPITIARIFNVLGPGQDELHFAGRMAGQIAAVTCAGAAPVLRAGLLSSTRDFLDVRDVCSALTALIESKLDGVCNVGSGVETNIGDLLQLLISAAHFPGSLQVVEESNATARIARNFADRAQLTQTAFMPKYSLRRSCEDMLGYYKDVLYTRAGWNVQSFA
jgi:GDP-4-dehydro-6-deoxy-D-mannose reductase